MQNRDGLKGKHAAGWALRKPTTVSANLTPVQLFSDNSSSGSLPYTVHKTRLTTAKAWNGGILKYYSWAEGRKKRCKATKFKNILLQTMRDIPTKTHDRHTANYHTPTTTCFKNEEKTQSYHTDARKTRKEKPTCIHTVERRASSGLLHYPMPSVSATCLCTLTSHNTENPTSGRWRGAAWINF